jgi:ABC-2 type transport system permease protein
VKSNILPVYFRELKAIFYSPVAYLVLFAFYILSSWFWMSIVSYFAQASMRAMRQGGGGGVRLSELFSAFYGNTAVTFIFLLPLVSMRLFSEEKKSGTIEMLFTYPLSDLDILLGKFFASLTLLLAMLLPLLILPLGIRSATTMHWPSVAVGFGGRFRMGAAFLALSLFTSALTENQVVAAAMGFGSLLLLFVVGWMEGNVSGFVRELLNQLSVTNHFQDLAKGVVNLKDLSYFALLIFVSLFATLRVLESKKWR